MGAIRDLLALIAQQTGFHGRVTWDTSRPGGQRRRRLDTSRAREAFGFTAETRLVDGLRATIAWYRARRQALARS